MAISNQMLLQYVTQAQNQAAAVLAQNAQQLGAITQALAGVNKAAAATAQGMAAAGGAMTRSATIGAFLGETLSNVASSAFSQLTGMMGSAIQQSIAFQNAFLGLGSIAKATGNSMDEATAAAQALSADGLMSVNESAMALKNLLAKGMNLQQATTLIKGLRDSAAFGRQGFLEFGQAVVGATEGIKNGLSAMSDNAGVTKNLSNIYKDAGLVVNDIGGKFKKTADAQKFLNAFLEETNNNMGDAAKLSETYSGQLSKLRTQMNLNLAAAGDLITKNEAIQRAIGLVGEALSESLKWWQENGRAMQQYVTGGVNLVIDAVTTAITLIVQWKEVLIPLAVAIGVYASGATVAAAAQTAFTAAVALGTTVVVAYRDVMAFIALVYEAYTLAAGGAILATEGFSAALTTALALIPGIGWALLAVAAAVAGVVAAWRNWDKISDWVADASLAVQGYSKEVRDAAQASRDLARAEAESADDRAAKQKEYFDEFSAQHARFMAQTKNATDAQKAAALAQAKNLPVALRNMEALTGAVMEMQAQGMLSAKTLPLVAEKIKALGLPAEQLSTILADLAAQFDSLNVAAKKPIPAPPSLKEVLAEIAATTKAFNDFKKAAGPALAAAIKDPNSDLKVLADRFQAVAGISPEFLKRWQAEIKETGKAADKAGEDAKNFAEKYKELITEMKAGEAAGLTTSQMMEKFSGSLKGLTVDAAIYGKFIDINTQQLIKYAEAYGKLDDEQKKLLDAMPMWQKLTTAQKEAVAQGLVLEKELRSMRNEMAGIIDPTERWGTGLWKLDALLHGVSQVTTTWMKANEAMLDQMLANRIAGEDFSDTIDTMLDQYEAWRISSQALARQVQMEADVMRKAIEIDELRLESIERLKEANEELAQAGMNEQQKALRQIQVAAKKTYDEIKKKIGEVIIKYEQLRIVQGRLTEEQEKQRDAELAGWGEILDAAIMSTDGQVLAQKGATDKMIREHARLAKAAQTGAADAVKAYKDFVAKTEKELKRLKKISDSWLVFDAIIDSLDTVKDVFGETAGKIIGSIVDIGRAIQTAKGATDKWHDAMAEFDKGNMAAGIAGVAASIGDMIKAMDQATNSGSRLQNIIGGAMTGAQIGSIAGPWGILAGAIAGAIIGGLRKNEWAELAKDVGRDLGVNMTEGLAKELEAQSKELGRQVTEALNIGRIVEDAGGINKVTGGITTVMSKLRDLFTFIQQGRIDVEQAAEAIDDAWDLILGESMSTKTGLISVELLDLIRLTHEWGVESEKVADFLNEMTDQIAEGFSGVAKGFADPFVKAKEGADETKDKIDELKDKAAELKEKLAEEEGKSGMERLKRDLAEVQELMKTEKDPVELEKLKQAVIDINRLMKEGDPVAIRKLKDELKGVNDEIAEATAENNKFTKQLQQMGADGQESFDRMGRFAVASFQAAIHNGATFMEAIEAIGPGLDSLIEAQKQLGFASSGAFDEMLQFRDFVMQNEELADSIGSLQKMMVGFANSGQMTQELFTDFGAEATAQMQRMANAGVAPNVMMKAMQPTLQTLYEMQERFGYKVDESTQAMLDEAVAAGAVGDAHKNANERMIDAIDKMVDHLDLLLEAMGVTLPVAADKAAKAAEDAAKRQGDAAKKAADDTKKAADDAAKKQADAANQVEIQAKEAAREAQRAAEETSRSADKSATHVDGVSGAFDDLSSQLRGSEDAFRRWADVAAAAADKAYRAVNKVSQGESPGGIKEIALELAKANTATKEFEQKFVSSMDKAYDAIPTNGPAAPVVGTSTASAAPLVVTAPVPVVAANAPSQAVATSADGVTTSTPAGAAVAEAAGQSVVNHFHFPNVIDARTFAQVVDETILPLMNNSISLNRRQVRTNLRQNLGVDK